MNKHASQTIAVCFRDNRGRLILRDTQGREYRDVRPIRMFPITDPEGWISICDSQCSELLCIESIEAVPAESLHIFEKELNRCMFTPVIQQITRSVPVADNVRLFIVTDRGATDIAIDTEDIYRLSGNRVLIKDLSGIRYLIPDWHKMSAHSRKILDMYL
ncbi:DUF1854 domain-containing protein [Thermodesulfobacteriota bacterium]